MLNCCTVVVAIAVVVVGVVVTTILCESCCCDYSCTCICKCCTVVCYCYCCCCFLYPCCCLVCFVVFFIVVVVCCVVVFFIAVVVSLSFWGLATRDFVDLVDFSQKKQSSRVLTCAWQEYLGLSRQILASFRPRSRRPMCQRQADQVGMIMFRPGDPLNFSWHSPGVSQASRRARSCFSWESGKLWLVFNRGPL